MREILVLGATGFIGGHIVKAGLESGFRVSGLRRNPDKVGHLGGLDLEWIHGDLLDKDSILAAMQGKGAVFHAAAYYPRDEKLPVHEHVNRGLHEIQSVLEAFRVSGAGRLIYTSSLSTIGQPPTGSSRPADERDIYQPGSMPNNAYYEVKIAMEQQVLEAAGEGMDAVILNPTAVFGPGDVNLATGRILIWIARGLALIVPPGTINVIDVRDTAAAHIQSFSRGRSGERYILGGQNLTVPEFVTAAARLSGVRPPLFTLPEWFLPAAVTLADFLPLIPDAPDHLRALTRKQRYTIDKAVKHLNLDPRGLEETISESILWFDRHGYLP